MVDETCCFLKGKWWSHRSEEEGRWEELGGVEGSEADVIMY